MAPVEEPLTGLTLDEKLDRIAEMLRSIADEEPEMRRRLKDLRRTPEYEAAYTTPDPLVSILIPTYTGVDTLRDVALPSALAQTYQNVEVVVVGDAAPPETAEMIAAYGDPRIRFHNLPMRGPYPDDTTRAWLIAGTPPFNSALADARGQWIAPFSDDDALAPDQIERLLDAAVSRRLELAYGRLRGHLADGRTVMVGEFPPRLREFGMQSAIYHAGLAFMEHNLSDEIFDVPNDWSLCRRMMRAGVRMGLVEDVIVDYYPSYEWGRRERPQERVPSVDPSAALERAEAAERALGSARAEAETLSARVADLERQIEVFASSKSWRMTRPLRALGERVRDR
jgi:Glycosyl transferase family 2